MRGFARHRAKAAWTLGYRFARTIPVPIMRARPLDASDVELRWPADDGRPQEYRVHFSDLPSEPPPPTFAYPYLHPPLPPAGTALGEALVRHMGDPLAPLSDADALLIFASFMQSKLYISRRSGWQNMTPAAIWAGLMKNVEERDAVDIANYAMMYLFIMRAERQRAEGEQGGLGLGDLPETTKE